MSIVSLAGIVGTGWVQLISVIWCDAETYQRHSKVHFIYSFRGVNDLTLRLIAQCHAFFLNIDTHSIWYTLSPRYYFVCMRVPLYRELFSPPSGSHAVSPDKGWERVSYLSVSSLFAGIYDIAAQYATWSVLLAFSDLPDPHSAYKFSRQDQTHHIYVLPWYVIHSTPSNSTAKWHSTLLLKHVTCTHRIRRPLRANLPCLVTLRHVRLSKC